MKKFLKVSRDFHGIFFMETCFAWAERKVIINHHPLFDSDTCLKIIQRNESWILLRFRSFLSRFHAISEDILAICFLHLAP